MKEMSNKNKISYANKIMQTKSIVITEGQFIRLFSGIHQASFQIHLGFQIHLSLFQISILHVKMRLFKI